MRAVGKVGVIVPLGVAAVLGAMISCSDATRPTQVQFNDAERALVGAAPSAPGLVAAYGFDAATGTAVTDASGQGNTGTLGSGVTRTTAGKFGGALVFNRGYVTVPDNAMLDLTSGMTLEAWVYPTAASTGWTTAIFKEQPGEYVYALYSGTPSSAVGAINVGADGVSERGAKSASAAPLNTWTHLATTYD